MRRWGVVALALLAVVAIAAVSATAAPTPAQLQRQIRALEKRVNSLERKVSNLTRAAAAQEQCESVIPIAQYGGVNNEGYLYGTNGGADVFLTTGLDVVPEADLDQPGFVWMLVVDASCVSASSSRGPTAKPYRPAVGRLAARAHARR